MDILLTHGYFLHADPHEQQVMRPYPPLGILYLSAYLKQQGFAVAVYDTTFSSLAAFQDYLLREQPGVVGIYTNMMTKQHVLAMIRLCKAQGATVILGGPDPPHYALEYLIYGADIIVIGEGELTLEALLRHLAQQGRQGLEAIAGIAFLNDEGALIRTPPRPFIPDLDSLPMPDREAIDLPAYMQVWKTHHGQSSVSLICARGCPYTCTWCSHSVYGESHRRRSPEKMADELAWIKEHYNPDLLWYADDVFTLNRRWFFRYHAELKRRGLKIPFECISRADRLDDEVIAALAEMGCYRLWNGSESGSQQVLDAMQRRVKVEAVRHVTQQLQQHGIQAGMFIMLGYDGEAIEDIRETVQHLKAANPDIFLTTVAYPIKGTAYYRAVEDRILASRPWAQRSDRDLSVAGRHSRRFYSFATRWMVNEVALHRARSRGSAGPLGQFKMASNIALGRLGMYLTQHEVEGS